VPKMCTRCSLQFDDATSLSRHMRTVHGSPGWHLCHLCADCFSTGTQLERHVEALHQGKTETSHPYVCQLCAESPPGQQGGAMQSYTVRGMLTKHLQSAHGVPRVAAANMARAVAPTPVPDIANTVQGGAEAVRRLFVCGEESSVYRCSRCDFSTPERAVFMRHAAEQHSPTLASAVQCFECAAAFTVASALQRHLRAIHRIHCDDIQTYLRDNGGPLVSRCPTPESSTTTTDDEPLSPQTATEPSSGGRHSTESASSGGVGRSSQGASTSSSTVSVCDADEDESPAECTVCYRVFLTRHLLRAHMRTHGIAFIQHTRRRLATSTSPIASSSPA